MIKNISNLGDTALYCDFGKEVNKELNQKVIHYFNTLRNKKFQGITNITPSYNKLIITFDLNITNFDKTKKLLENLEIDHANEIKSKTIKIPICVEKNFHLDLEHLEKKLKISKEEILDNFLLKEYFCYMTGFIAGMPFLGDINKDIRTERLETPRVKVPKGAVGITEQFCNIYTFESPGGWNIIGNTPINIFNKNSKINPALVNPGDKVSFYKITSKEYYNWNDKK
tara:strand:- start:517 stop:1197 length:681 start_codon:yes stop_codon:yes gene_type:complete